MEQNFWKDQRTAKKLLQEKARLEQELESFKVLEQSFEDAQTLFELTEEEEDQDSYVELSDLVRNLYAQFSTAEMRKLLSDDDDVRNAILSINAGSGGTESQDWAQMLLRMYQRFSERSGYKVQFIDALAGEEAGIKNTTISISGTNAYGFLKAEVGVHRLVRISPFDSNKRRHTSFASVFVSPEIDDDVDITVDPKDIRIDVYRAGGHGGQGVNTTDSAVRITHYPTGIVVTCQQERSQIKNKAMAMKVLRSRLYERHLEDERKKQQKIEDNKREISWGSQIRSYVLHPYKMVKDHRTGESMSSADKVLDGDIGSFIKAYLTCRVTGVWARDTGGDEI